MHLAVAFFIISYKKIQLTAGWGGGYGKDLKIKIIFPFSKYCKYQSKTPNKPFGACNAMCPDKHSKGEPFFNKCLLILLTIPQFLNKFLSRFLKVYRLVHESHYNKIVKRRKIEENGRFVNFYFGIPSSV